jgi:hypothetical protein
MGLLQVVRPTLRRASRHCRRRIERTQAKSRAQSASVANELDVERVRGPGASYLKVSRIGYSPTRALARSGQVRRSSPNSLASLPESIEAFPQDTV